MLLSLNGVVPGLRGDDLLLNTRQQPLRFGQGQTKLAILTRSSGLLISMMSVHGPSPSPPIFTNLNIQATHPPLVREQTRKYPTGRRTPNLAAVPWIPD